ncbi:putative hydrolase of the HAD superfamily [Cyclonatronum proteinivorum]|uniref:Putative hydrolase of the HAD superfamily n=1 Tax=Cyclonatronum proteinivorum TaxID=1457365 RepID=A0A345UJU4_9BACT|nr:YjjG family noncanonical pyrimidine nucleotidase [Cyclonatronum proteinivorum]AXJ00746.1 putative hydrolase of the HAD superfamily [Cyclonatronum proteinivorum]
MLRKPRFIYFDIDDTLLDHRSAQRAALLEIHQEFPVLQAASAADLSLVYARHNQRLWQAYSLGQTDRHNLHRSRFADTFAELGLHVSDPLEIGNAYMQAYRRYWRWIPGAEAALQSLSRHYRVGFITNGFSETQKKKIEDFGLQAFSGPLIISEDVGYLKPSPEIFAYAESQAGAEAADILYVGDSLDSDIRGGNAAGWQTAWFTPQAQPEPQVSCEASVSFQTFEELQHHLHFS